MKIDYMVYFFVINDLLFIYWYGYVVIDDMKVSVDINFCYGEFRVGDLGINVRIDMVYFKGYFGDIGNFDVFVVYGGLYGRMVGDLDVDVCYVIFELEEGGLVISWLGYSNFNLGVIVGFWFSSSSYDCICI